MRRFLKRLLKAWLIISFVPGIIAAMFVLMGLLAPAVQKIPFISEPTMDKIDRILATQDAGPTATKTPAPTEKWEFTAEDFIPSDYYRSPCPIPKGVSLNSYLTDYQWVDPYQANRWDCSQMAAYIEWLAENCGYEANIVIATSISHSWVEIKIGNKWRQYEATGGSFYLAPAVLRAINEGKTRTFKDIYKVYDYSVGPGMHLPVWDRALSSFMAEWAWWEE